MNAVHPHVQVDGIAVDEALAPLLTELWKRGLRTDFSCQGDWSGPEYTLGKGSKEDLQGIRQWSPEEEDVDRASYILFSDLEDAAYFLWETIRLLRGVATPEDLVLHDAQLKLEQSDTR